MHIVGLLGMPRRVYTYPGGLGWTAYNVAETIGGYLTRGRDPRRLGNLAWSYRRGARRRARSLARADARVDDELAAAATTTSRSSRR